MAAIKPVLFSSTCSVRAGLTSLRWSACSRCGQSLVYFLAVDLNKELKILLGPLDDPVIDDIELYGTLFHLGRFNIHFKVPDIV